MRFKAGVSAMIYGFKKRQQLNEILYFIELETDGGGDCLYYPTPVEEDNCKILETLGFELKVVMKDDPLYYNGYESYKREYLEISWKE